MGRAYHTWPNFSQALDVEDGVGFGAVTSAVGTTKIVHAQRGLIVADVRLDNSAELLSKLGRRASSARPDDAEMIGLAYDKWGDQCVHHLAGAYAFAVWDSTARTLLCVRDHLGLRPFFYFRGGGFLAFSTSPPAMRFLDEGPTELDDEVVVAQFGNVKHVLKERTALIGLKRLPGGSALKLVGKAPSRSATVYPYWFPDRILEKSTTKEQARLALRHEIGQAVSRSLPDDTKIAAHVSGGLDSAIVSLVAQQELLHRRERLSAVYSWSPPYSAADGGGSLEYPRVEGISRLLGVGPYYCSLTVEDILREWSSDPRYEPCETLHFERQICRVAENAGQRVILSGWGGDEVVTFRAGGVLPSLLKRGAFLDSAKAAWSLFATGNGFRSAGWPDSLLPWTLRRGRYGIPKNIPHIPGVDKWVVAKMVEMRDTELRMLYHNPSGFRSRACAWINHGHLGHRAESWALLGEAHGLEYRYPLLDKRLVEYHLSLPEVFFASPRAFVVDSCSDILPKIAWSRQANRERARIGSMLANWRCAIEELSPSDNHLSNLVRQSVIAHAALTCIP
jgi:asparagine synthase (glutamine-hydrolysing)